MAAAPEQSPPPQAFPWIRIGACVVLLVATGMLAARTIRTTRTYDSVRAAPRTEAFDPVERARRERDVVGTFATGSAPGDRVIVVQPDGRIRFQLVGPLAPTLTYEDTYEVRKRGREVCLVTRANGAVDILDIDQLTYWDDVYRRQPGGPTSRVP